MEHILLPSDLSLTTISATCQSTPAFENDADRNLFAARQKYYKFDEYNERWSPTNEHLNWFPDALTHQLNQFDFIIKTGTVRQQAEAKALYNWYLPFSLNVKAQLGNSAIKSIH